MYIYIQINNVYVNTNRDNDGGIQASDIKEK